jgi:hypothetical protein
MWKKSQEQRRFDELEQVAAQSQVGRTRAPKAKGQNQIRPTHNQREPRSRAMNCSSCGVALRPKNASAEDYPKTERNWYNGLCRPCAPAERLGTGKAPRGPRTPMPERCPGCDRRLRNASTKLVDAPDTVVYVGHGMCGMCRARTLREEAGQ